MAFIPVPDTVEIVPNFFTASTGQNAKNVLHVRMNITPIVLAILEVIAEAYIDWYTNHYRAYVSSSVQLTSVYLRDLTTENGAVLEYNTGLPVAGSVASPVMPSNVTYATKFLTGQAGRSFRGRSYHVGLSEGQVSGDSVIAGTANGILAAWNEWVDVDVPAIDGVAVVVSKYSGGLPRTSGLATPIVTVAQTDLRVDTQRRRLQGQGS